LDQANRNDQFFPERYLIIAKNHQERLVLIYKRIAKQYKKNYVFGVKTLSLLGTFLTRDKLMDSFTWTLSNWLLP